MELMAVQPVETLSIMVESYQVVSFLCQCLYLIRLHRARVERWGRRPKCLPGFLYLATINQIIAVDASSDPFCSLYFIKETVFEVNVCSKAIRRQCSITAVCNLSVWICKLHAHSYNFLVFLPRRFRAATIFRTWRRTAWQTLESFNKRNSNITGCFRYL